MWQIITAATEEQIAEARRLTREYAAGTGLDLEFQGFAAELAELPGEYAPPGGRLLLAWDGDCALGMVAVRPLGGDIGELKRLYVAPSGRGRGLGRALTRAAVEAAREIGYSRLRLDTLPAMTEALALYESLGFRPIAPYRHNPVAGAVFLERNLAHPERGAVVEMDHRPRTFDGVPPASSTGCEPWPPPIPPSS